jgi:hypothetical protein
MSIGRTERDILQALEGLPASALEQVKDFIIFLKETKGSQRPLLKEKVLAKKQREAIKKWAGTNLGPGFSGREHGAILYDCMADRMTPCN